MPEDRLQRSLRVIFLGMAANVLLAAGKFFAGVMGHSHALIADAVESLADVFSSVIVWRGVVVANAPPDAEHPYGHGKAEPLASALVAIILLIAAGWIVIQSVTEIIQPHAAPKPFTLFVLIGIVIIKESLFRFVLKESAVVGSSAVHADAIHHRSDAITSLAAGIGISVSLLGGEKFAAADDLAAIVAAAIIAWNGWRLLRPALNELMDTAPSPEMIEQFRQIAATISGVNAVEKCFARKMGFHYFVDLHVEVDPQMTVEKAHEIAHRVKDEIRARLPAVRDVLVHVEPAKP
ncbi:MAG: cation diffusion facilitator family transporter [Verrucomicrobiota bacterium]